MLVKPAGPACSMRCGYCFYRDVASRREGACGAAMAPDVASAVVRRALEVAPDASCSFDFQGGEPTLAGIDFFRRFVGEVEAGRSRQRVSYAIQTNGLALDDEWCAFLAENRFLVGLSLDGTRALHDAARPDAAGRPTWDRVEASLHRLRRHGVEPTVLCVLTREVARHPQQVWRGLDSLRVRYVQFIPCVAELDGVGPAAAHALTPERFASFYRGFLDAWERGSATGHPMSVGLFDDVMALSLGRRPRTCGVLGACAPQFVVEADGTVYPCDFHATDEWALGSVVESPLEELAAGRLLRSFLSRGRERAEACGDCPFEGICHGHCPRLSSAFIDGDSCGYRDFLSYGYRRLRARALSRVGAGPWA